jgi:dienelactone hydrolase
VELQPIGYEADGRAFTGYLADGSGGGSVPGILVIHEGGGLTGHVRERAARLARLGYVAFAMDLFGMAEFDLEEAKAIVRALRADLAALRGRAGAALQVLARHPNVDARRLAAIELARGGAELAAVVGFHAGLTRGSADDNRAIGARLLLCLGVDDPVVTPEQRTAFAWEMTAAGLDWQVHLYGGVGHSFTNREIDAWNLPGFAYHPVADRRSWAAMLGLFDEVF